MTIGLPILIGFLVATLGTLPPGLLNMTAAKISMRDGRNRALWFAFGASIVVFFQTIIAVFFARFLEARTDIGVILQEVGFVIFSALTVYFFIAARKPKIKKKKEEIKMRSKSSRFFMGMLLSALNLLPVPYYVFVSVTLASYDYFYFENTYIYFFTTSATFAAFFVFFGYITFFKSTQQKTSFLSENINYIIAAVTGTIAVITLIKIINRFS